MKYRYFSVLAMGLAFAACSDEGDDGGDRAFTCEQEARENCIEIPAGDSDALLLALNDDLKPNTTVILGEGTYMLDQTVTITTPGTHLIGQGIEKSTLDFSSMGAGGSDGVFVNGVDNFLVQDLTVLDSVKDGIRVEDSDGVVFRRIRATWTNEGDENNGAYGIYPVKSKNVLVEDSFAENASDAGLYVGQCEYAIVRNNVVRGNVAGLEIENTQYADVYGNLAEDNTGGIVVFDLPGNPIVGRDVRVRDNVIRGNNRKNFAPMGVVKNIPAGTGTFAMASRRVEITNNTYENNKTVDIAVINGLLVDDKPSTWRLETASLIGNWEDLGLPVGVREVLDEEESPTGAYEEVEGTIGNYRSDEVVVAGNTHSGSGMEPDKDVLFGIVISGIFENELPVPSVLYENIGESSFDLETEGGISNDHHVCAGGNVDGDFAVARLFEGKFKRYSDDFGPFSCTELTAGPVGDVVLSGN